MLVLASASPRRRELLTAAGIPHLVRPANIPEIRQPDESSQQLVRRLARQKAESVHAGPEDIILGADTVVCVGDQVLGKAPDRDQARQMLATLSGRQHTVETGICLKQGQRLISDLAATQVYFAPLSDREIEEYLNRGEWRDKAGAYAIQGLASRFVERIEGSYHNVVGLPVSLVYRNLLTLTSVS